MDIVTPVFVLTANDRVDIEFEYHIESGVNNSGLLGCVINTFKDDGQFSNVNSGFFGVDFGTAPKGQWIKYRASLLAGTGTGLGRLYLLSQGNNGGNCYIRNAKSYRVPGANTLLNASGRGTSATLASTNGVAGIRSLNLTGFALTQTKQTNSVTINVSQSQYYLDTGVTLTYPSASFGGYAYSTTYYFWRDDPNLDGGSGYGSSANAQDALAPGRVYLGYITTQNAGGTGGGGGGGGAIGCVAPDMFVEIEGAGPTKARDVRAGDRILCLTADMAGTEFVEVEASRPALNLRCRLVADSGEELDLATNTPVPRERGGYDMAGNAWTAPVPVGGAGAKPSWRRAVAEALPWGTVQRISCGGRVYGAGREPGRYIFTHNAVAKP
jgi:hypothetical protein